MENLMLNKQNDKKFTLFAAALASVVFIVFNLLFLQLYSFVPNSTISGNIIISNTATIDGTDYNVTKIDEKAFYAGSKIENIVISSGIEEIGEMAFAGTGIYSVFIPSTVKIVKASSSESGPFYACRSKLVIYLEASEVPEGFEEFWNYRTSGQEFEVKVGYTWSSYLAEIEKTESDFVSTNDSQVAYTINSDGTVAATKGAEGFSKSNKIVYYLASFMVEFLFAVSAYVVALFVKTNIWQAAGMNKKINGKIVLLGLAISIVCLIFFSGLTETFMSFLYTLGYTSPSYNINIPNFGIYLVYVFTSCLVPAVCEELLFRGVILSGLKEKGENVALFCSAIIFTLMHGSPDQTIHQFVIGLIVGYIFIKSGNLWLGVIVHFFNNFIAITELFIAQTMLRSGIIQNVMTETEEALTTSSSSAFSIVSLILSTVFTVLMAYFGYRIIKILIGKIVKESNKINGIVEEKTENSNEINTQVTTISVDGQVTEAEMTIAGENNTETPKSIEEEARADFENDELFAEIQQKHEANESNINSEKPKVSVVTIGLFIISGAYLVIDWFIALISGL